MLNSIFRKWLLASIAITIAILLVLSISLNWFVQRDFYRQSFNQLDKQASSVEVLYEQLSQGNLTQPEFRKELKTIEKEHEVSISILGKKTNYFKQDLYAVGVRPDIKSWVISVNNGARIEKIAKFRKQDDAKMLIVGFPLYRNNQNVASVFVYSSVTNVKELAAPIRRSIWLVALAAVGPLIVLLWLATRRFVEPIRKLDKAAQSVAQGDFTVRVQTQGEDEVSRLGSSFNMMAERIERIEEQRRRLIMEIAHELRTPLTSIRATLQALSDGLLSEAEQKEFGDAALAESLRLGTLIDNIHELSAFEEHQIKFEFTTVNLTELVEQTVMQFKPNAALTDMELLVDANQANPLLVQADPLRIRQVLINLIGNAINHNDKGTRVIIRLRSNKDKVRMIVHDNGNGIAPEHLPHLFERLYKAESSRSSKGYGLGLTISRYIVHAHRGSIVVLSEVGQGTEIQVRLPLKAE
ncbi:HAMP domain-containing histidine kinase [Paenibacillus rhizovicinus]|uniref:histidine kinase n=1 Tax=Paenibacillus rhizovicinus TaxID=2704463 RepID=A0A6C0NU59_9BACL|nr:ATP-binding protein [Paenibacillus rhizovicinus]QHW29750.1 HAMP domain-containing histidine kinase [Paenibacillus rhizovicinus]